jgi:hypothetical protein
MTLFDKTLDRRTLLRGMLKGGTAVMVGLPLLECFLDSTGTAYAAAGGALPPCFGTWHWSLGLIPDHWVPAATGSKYELPEHLAALRPIQSKINLYSGMQVFLDGKVNQNHYSGAQAQMTGMVSRNGSDYTTSLDTIIGDHIQPRARFRSIEVACNGNRRGTWSSRGATGMNPAEISPLELYTRIFGPEFVDPNNADFKPDPEVMVRHSVLSAVTEQRLALMNKVSSADRARLDQYFQSLRDLEQKLALELEKPAALPGCTVPRIESEPESLGTMINQVGKTQRQFAQLLGHALACGQTQVINVALASGSGGGNSLSTPGDPKVYHSQTHEEPIDPALGYQPKCKEYAEDSMKFFTEFVQVLESIPEGAGTLLDRTVVFAFTDHGEARIHSMKKYPIFTAGSGAGRLKTGLHVNLEGDAATRVGFTLMHALGVPKDSWGTESNQTSKPISEVLE